MNVERKKGLPWMFNVILILSGLNSDMFYRAGFDLSLVRRPCPRNANVQYEPRLNSGKENDKIMASESIVDFITEVIPRYCHVLLGVIIAPGCTSRSVQCRYWQK